MSLKETAIATLVSLTVLAPAAGAKTNLKDLAKEIKALKQQNQEQQKLIEKMEKELKRLSESNKAAKPAEGKRGKAAFNPAMSLILEAAGYRDSKNGEGDELLAAAVGFSREHTHEHEEEGERRAVAEEEGHQHGGGVKNGLGIKATELAVSATVDPYFDAQAQLIFEDGALEVEEAYVTTRSLPKGWRAKMGRFLSNIGYQNSHHPHQWAFADQALPYRTLMGGGVGEDGVQVTWTPPTKNYTLIGLELLQGESDVAPFVGETTVTNPAGAEVDIPFRLRRGPRLKTIFMKWVPEVGENNALQLGLFGGDANTHQEVVNDEQFLEGKGNFWGVDMVYQHDSHKPFGEGDWKIEGEYLRRAKKLRIIEDFDDPAEIGVQQNTRQDGLYLQGTLGLAPRLQGGLRYDAVGLLNEVEEAGVTTSFKATRRLSAVLNFRPTEFSRFYLQWNMPNVAQAGGGHERFNQFFLGYQMNLGAHGAHKF